MRSLALLCALLTVPALSCSSKSKATNSGGAGGADAGGTAGVGGASGGAAGSSDAGSSDAGPACLPNALGCGADPLGALGNKLFDVSLDKLSDLTLVIPGMGAPTHTLSDSSFPAGRCDGAADFPTSAATLAYPEVAQAHANIRYDVGTLMFWYAPHQASGNNRELFRSSNFTSLGGLRVFIVKGMFTGVMRFGDGTEVSAKADLSAHWLDECQVHLAMSWDASELRLFVYGKKSVSVAVPALARRVETASESFNIGSSSGASAEGLIDELKIYDTAFLGKT